MAVVILQRAHQPAHVSNEAFSEVSVQARTAGGLQVLTAHPCKFSNKRLFDHHAKLEILALCFPKFGKVDIYNSIALQRAHQPTHISKEPFFDVRFHTQTTADAFRMLIAHPCNSPTNDCLITMVLEILAAPFSKFGRVQLDSSPRFFFHFGFLTSVHETMSTLSVSF